MCDEIGGAITRPPVVWIAICVSDQTSNFPWVVPVIFHFTFSCTKRRYCLWNHKDATSVSALTNLHIFNLTISGGLGWICSDHPQAVHAFLDVWSLVHHLHGSLSPRTRPFEMLIMRSGSQVEVDCHFIRAVLLAVNVQANLKRVTFPGHEGRTEDLGTYWGCIQKVGKVKNTPSVVRTLRLREVDVIQRQTPFWCMASFNPLEYHSEFLRHL